MSPRPHDATPVPLREVPCATADWILATVFAWEELEYRLVSWGIHPPECPDLDRPTAVRLAAHAVLHGDPGPAAALDALCRRWCTGAVGRLRLLATEDAAEAVHAAFADEPGRAAAMLYAAATDGRPAVQRAAEHLRRRLETAAVRAWRFGGEPSAIPEVA